MSDTDYSPRQTSRTEPSAPWTIDNSDSRVSSIVGNTPRSILKETRTPNPYISPQYNRIQNEHFESIANRRVSFASSTRVRFYGTNETPNSPSHRTLNQKLLTTSPDDNDGNPIAATLSPDKGDSRPPAARTDNAFIARLSGSPMDRRKRRRDIFGSPPGQREEKRTSVIYPENRVRGMRKLGDDDDDDDDDDAAHDLYFRQFLTPANQQGRKRLFDDDDDDDDGNNNNNNNNSSSNKDDDGTLKERINGNDNNEEKGTQTASAAHTNASSNVSPLASPAVQPLATNTIYADNNVDRQHVTSPPAIRPLSPTPKYTDNDENVQQATSPPAVRPLSPNTIYADNDVDRQHTASPPDPLLAFFNPDEQTDYMPPAHYATSTQSRTFLSAHNVDNSTMALTQQPNGEDNRQEGLPIDDTAEIWNRTATVEVHHQERQRQYGSSQEPQQSSTDQHDLPMPVSSSIHTTQFNSQGDSQDSDMKLTRGHPPLRETQQPNDTPRYLFSTSSPVRSPIRPPFRSPLRSSSSNTFNLPMAKSPRVGMSILDTMNVSPILPRQSPLVDSSHAPPPPLSNAFSPKRSFYLHDPNQSHTPLATTTTTTPPPPKPFSKSPLRQEHSINRVPIDHSLASDDGDGMLSIHGDENYNILEEEFPLYDSFTEDTPTTKSVNMVTILDNAAGFNQMDHDIPLPELETVKKNYGTGLTPLDEQATAAAFILPELDMCRKWIEKYEQLIQNLTDHLQQLGDDISENTPQICAEYVDATAEVGDEMEKRLAELRKFMTVESELEWFTNYAPTVRDLVALYKEQEVCLVKDHQLLRQAKDRLTEKLPLIAPEKQKWNEAIKAAEERLKVHKQVDPRDVKTWESEIEEQRIIIEAKQKKCQQVEEKIIQKGKETVLLGEKKAELQASIAKYETTVGANPYISRSDFLRSKDQFEATSSLCAWNLKDQTDGVTQFTVYGDLDVLIDANKLKNHQVDAVFIGMLESKDREYGPFAELVHGLQVLAKETWSQQKIIQDIMIYWTRLRLIRKEILAVKQRFWLELDPHIENPFTDTDMRGFRCTITVFSYMSNLKFLLSFEILAKHVMAYPHSLDLSQLKIDFEYGDTTPEYLEMLIKHKLQESGIFGLVDTLCAIVDDFQ